MRDKTGTVTTGRMTLHKVTPADGEDPAELLRLAGAVEDGSQHPIGRAIASAAREAGPLSPVERFRAVDGLGVAGQVDRRAVLVGNPALLAEFDIEVPERLAAELTEWHADGCPAVLVAWDWRARGVLIVTDSSSRPPQPSRVYASSDCARPC